MHEMNAFQSGNDDRTDIEWLWKPYIQYGKVTVVDGEMNAGKTTLTVHIAAAATTGTVNQRPSDRKGYSEKAINVFYLASRDNINDFVLPRFERYGGDRWRICFNDETRSHMILCEDSIKFVLEKTGVRLMVIDPWQDFLDYDTDDENRSSAEGEKSDTGVECIKDDIPARRLTKRQKADRLYGHLNVLAKAANIAIVIVNRRDRGFRQLYYRPRLVLSRTNSTTSYTDIRKYSDDKVSDWMSAVQFRVDADRKVQFIPRRIDSISVGTLMGMDAATCD